MSDSRELPNTKTRRVMVAGVPVGAGEPVRVQSMCTTPTTDASSTLEQISGLAEAGCEIIRVAVPSEAALVGFEEIARKSPLPVVADIHFDYRLAIGSLERGAAALRINPGNIGSWERVDAVIDAAKEMSVPIRIGVNAGSLYHEIAERHDLSLSDKLVLSCEEFVRHFEERGFFDIVLSAKAHSVPVTIDTYRKLSQRLPAYPLHIGVTEAGTSYQGSVKNCVAVGALLAEGIGDTMRLSLTADPVDEVRLAWEVLAVLGLRRNKVELVSCPTCGRTQVDLISMAKQVEERLKDVHTPLTVAVMGCVVNGPGEAKDADIGIACGKGKGSIFIAGKPVRTVDEEFLVDELMAEIAQLEQSRVS